MIKTLILIDENSSNSITNNKMNKCPNLKLAQLAKGPTETDTPVSMPVRRKSPSGSSMDTLSPGTSPGMTPLFEKMFNFHELGTPTLKVPRFFRKSTTDSVSSSSLASGNSAGSSSSSLMKEKSDPVLFLGYDPKAAGMPCPAILRRSRENITFYPFCEEYDGFSRRKTKTISESIKALQNEQNIQIQSVESVSPVEDATHKSTAYFDRLKDLRYILQQTTSDAVNNEPAVHPTPCSPLLTPKASQDELVQEDVEKATVERTESAKSSFRLQTTLQRASARSSKVASIRTEFSNDTSDCAENNYVGSVDLKVNYDYSLKSLCVTVIKADDVSDPQNINSIINPFVKLVIYPSENKKCRTRIISRSRHPFFNETFNFGEIAERSLSGMSLLLQLYHKKHVGSKRLGETLVWLDDIDLSDGNIAYVTEMFRMHLY